MQAAIDAAVSGGERTEADPALVLILPGDYTEDVALKKHVALLGLDRLNQFSTIIRGQMTCSLTPVSYTHLDVYKRQVADYQRVVV